MLGWVVADLAFRSYRDLPEGKLTDLRKSVVNASALAEVAAASSTSARACCSGKGEDAAGGRQKPSILSDALEAVLGAVYLDGGVDRRPTTSIERLFGRAAASRPRSTRPPRLQDACCRS